MSVGHLVWPVHALSWAEYLHLWEMDKILLIARNVSKLSFEDKNFKVNNGESLNEVDNRLKSFISDLLDNDSNKIAIVMHGIILLSYLKTICNHFEFDGRNFNIKYNDNVVLEGTPKNPSIYKIEFDDNKNVINVEYVECDL